MTTLVALMFCLLQLTVWVTNDILPSVVMA